jgi:hypothetical protein
MSWEKTLSEDHAIRWCATSTWLWCDQHFDISGCLTDHKKSKENQLPWAGSQIVVEKVDDGLYSMESVPYSICRRTLIVLWQKTRYITACDRWCFSTVYKKHDHFMSLAPRLTGAIRPPTASVENWGIYFLKPWLQAIMSTLMVSNSLGTQSNPRCWAARRRYQSHNRAGLWEGTL